MPYVWPDFYPFTVNCRSIAITVRLRECFSPSIDSLCSLLLQSEWKAITSLVIVRLIWPLTLQYESVYSWLSADKFTDGTQKKLAAVISEHCGTHLTSFWGSILYSMYFYLNFAASDFSIEGKKKNCLLKLKSASLCILLSILVESSVLSSHNSCPSVFLASTVDEHCLYGM